MFGMIWLLSVYIYKEMSLAIYLFPGPQGIVIIILDNGT